ncbi:MAG TPA: NAD(P)/FAD-dependent oxidoreductase [Thermoanaerobaculia bacterium]|nr:NAD(P)/FAD-dependent oxidoreductase [Thermoanaerobaculia bacterium]
MQTSYDLAVVGAGAAGLMAAIFAGRRGKRVVALDAAPKIGAKILISGGGRCNVTHDVVRAEDFNGNRNAIAKVLRAFDVAQTIAFFEELGVPLKREETGKLFPVSNRARDVVDALLRAAREAGVEIRTGARITSLDAVDAKHIILATGGRSVPKTGSDGSGYALARAAGHTVTPVFPALVPLIVADGHWARAISGTSVEAELLVKSPTGRVLHRERGSMLFTHFGLSGPAVLDVSRHFIAAQPATLAANFLPGETFESLEASLLSHENPHATFASILRRRLPDRLVAQLASDVSLNRLSKDERRKAIRNVVDCALPVERDRGFDYAEVTAGGVPLSEVDVSTMRSRIAPNLSLVGEILDVDGKIGGYNFQWAWATGFLAGQSL